MRDVQQRIDGLRQLIADQQEAIKEIPTGSPARKEANENLTDLKVALFEHMAIANDDCSFQSKGNVLDGSCPFYETGAA